MAGDPCLPDREIRGETNPSIPAVAHTPPHSPKALRPTRAPFDFRPPSPYLPLLPPPRQTPEGENGGWGNTELDVLYGPKGWCTSEQSTRE